MSNGYDWQSVGNTAHVDGQVERLKAEVERRGNLLEDVVNELDLSGGAIEKHGPLGTPPAELVREVLDQKDQQIRMLKNGMKEISPTAGKQEVCPDCGGPVKCYHDTERTRIICKDKCQGWKEIRVIDRLHQNKNVGNCKKCVLLSEIYGATKKTERDYYVMTELFVLLHGADMCAGKLPASAGDEKGGV